jgi:hypothetical protein
LALALGNQNTTLGYLSGNAITSGAKNTIIGAYTGNQGGLDIRTSSNNIVLSDGDGNPRAYYLDSTSDWLFHEGTFGIGGTSDASIYRTGANGSGLHFSTNSILPASNVGAVNDQAIQLGGSGNRFTDLYLSGGVYLGGTTSANQLDDYEEGTWNPTLVGGTSAGTTTYNGRSGDYTKIGNTVRVGFYISFTAATGTGEMRLGNLPFVQNADNANNVKLGGVMTDGLNWDVDGSLILMGTISTTYMRVGISRDDTAVHIQGVTNETATIWGTLTYITNS